jgi:hypothetical protein
VFLFTAEQYDRDHAALAVLLGLNGLRVSEACSTNVEDLGVERGHRTLRIVGKGNKPATVPLVPRTARTIDLAVGERHDGPILRRRDGQRLDRRTAHRWVRSIGKRAGLGGVHPHMLRAAFIMAALDAGVSLRDVQIAARHAHGAPPPFAPARLVGEDAQYPELARIVDDGFHPQHGGLVVDLHPVAGHSMADPPSPWSTFGVGDHLGGQGGMQLAAQEGEHVLGGHVQRGVADQVGPQVQQLGPGVEWNMTSVAISAWSSTQ